MKKKKTIFTFKADEELSQMLSEMPNRSAFIRSAIQSALRSSCPLCSGTGVLSDEQQKHWDHFKKFHSIEQCDQCQAIHITCENDSTTDIH